MVMIIMVRYYSIGTNYVATQYHIQLILYHKNAHSLQDTLARTKSHIQQRLRIWMIDKHKLNSRHASIMCNRQTYAREGIL